MRIVITGGGTGGHVYPALEVARVAAEHGAEVVYLGSNRGVEGGKCRERGIRFKGFDVEPVYKPYTLAGIRALLKIAKAAKEVRAHLEAVKPNVVFSTGGYSSAPVMLAASRAHIPLALHACDAVPGRSLRQFSKLASLITVSFDSAAKHFETRVTRTGHPIRDEIRAGLMAAQVDHSGPPKVLVVGGSGGARFLNQTMPKVAKLLPEVHFLHSTGQSQYHESKPLVEGLGSRYHMEPYLDALAMMNAYRTARVVVARAGSGISEFAMAGLPSILIPLPTSADDHQLANAKEFQEIGSATVLTEDKRDGFQQATPQTIAAAIQDWISNEPIRKVAISALHQWDAPDAAEQIFSRLQEVRPRLGG